MGGQIQMTDGKKKKRETDTDDWTESKKKK